MKFICEKSALQAAVNIASRAAAAKSPIPALEGILLECAGSNLRVTGYDLNKGMYTDIGVEVINPGSIVLGAKIFGDMVRSLPNAPVTVDNYDKMNVRITCGDSKFDLVGASSEDYPMLPEVDTGEEVTLPQKILESMISQTLFAVSDNEGRPIYTGEKFIIENGTLTVIAVDGYRLALRREKVETGSKQCDFVVPGVALSEVQKLCTDEEGKVRVALGKRHISFTLGSTVLVSRRLEGDFMNYRKVVPETFNVVLGASRARLQRSVERVSLVIDDRIKYPLHFFFGDGGVKIVCATALGTGEDECPLEGDGGNLEIGFNNRYMLDALKAAPADDISIGLNTGTSPCVITPAGVPQDEANFIYMVLPVRLRKEG